MKFLSGDALQKFKAPRADPRDRLSFRFRHQPRESSVCRQVQMQKTPQELEAEVPLQMILVEKPAQHIEHTKMN